MCILYAFFDFLKCALKKIVLKVFMWNTKIALSNYLIFCLIVNSLKLAFSSKLLPTYISIEIFSRFIVGISGFVLEFSKIAFRLSRISIDIPKQSAVWFYSDLSIAIHIAVLHISSTLSTPRARHHPIPTHPYGVLYGINSKLAWIFNELSSRSARFGSVRAVAWITKTRALSPVLVPWMSCSSCPVPTRCPVQANTHFLWMAVATVKLLISHKTLVALAKENDATCQTGTGVKNRKSEMSKSFLFKAANEK